MRFLAVNHLLFLWLSLATVQVGCVRFDATNQPLPSEETPAIGKQEAKSAAPDELKNQLDDALDFTFARRLNTRDHAAWQILHGCVPYREAFLIRDGEKDVPALDYLFHNGTVEGWEFEPGRVIDEATGRQGLRAIVRPGSNTAQGHPDQWLGYLAGCNFPLDKTLAIGGKQYLFGDYLAQMEFDVPHNLEKEYSWTLMALVCYHSHNYTWQAADGHEWSVAKLVEIELEQDLASSACAGSHRMVGLALAYHRFKQDGGELTGVWQRLHERLQETVAKVKAYQNADGTLSSASFSRASQSPDVGDALNAAGHVLEFLMVTLNDEQLQEPWVTRAVLAQCKLFRKTKEIDVNCGGLYHSASALRIYRERRFGQRSFGPAATEKT